MEGSSIVVKMPPQTFTTSIRPNSNQAAPIKGVILTPHDKDDDPETSFVVSYHREHETGDLIETLVSSNSNRVTARSVNSPDDVTWRVSQDLNQRHEPGLVAPTRYEYTHEPGRVAPTRYAYTHAPFRAAGPYSSSSLKEGHHFIPGTVVRHQTGLLGTMSDQGLSDAEAWRANRRPFVVTYQDQGHYRVAVEPSRVQRSPDSPRLWARSDKLSYIDWQDREGGQFPGVKLSSNSFTSRAKSLLGKSWTGRPGRDDACDPSKELLQDGQFILEGPDSRHDKSSVFIAVPVGSVKDKRRVEEMEEDKRKRVRGTRRTYLLPRSSSWSYPRRVHLDDTVKHSNADRNSHHDYDEEHGDALYIDDDGHLYAKTRSNNVTRDDNYVFFTPLELCKGRQLRYSLDDLDFVSTSDEEDYPTGKQKVKGRRRSRSNERRGGRHRTHSESDFEQTIPIYNHRRLRSDIPTARPRHERSRERRRRHTKHERSSSPSYSDHDDVAHDDYESNDSGKKHSKDMTRHQMRQQRPTIFSDNRENVSSINVTSLQDRDSNPYPLGMISPNTLSSNFALFPSLGFPPNVPNPYTGLPYSPTSRPTDQLARNNNITYTNMRSYLDAMSTSLANMPASTVSDSPYVSQQLLHQHSSYPMENVGVMDFLRSSNSNSDITPLEAPDAQMYSRSEGQRLSNQPSFSSDFQNTTVNGGAQEQNRKDGSPVIVAEVMPPAFLTNTNNDRSVLHNVNDVNDHVLDNTSRKTGKTARDVDGETHLSANGRQIPFSKESKFGPQEKSLNNSAVQTDSYLYKSPPATTMQSSPPGLDWTPPPPDAREFHLNRSPSRDIHTQTLKSLPPPTMPKPKGVISPEPGSPPPLASTPEFTSHRSTTSPLQASAPGFTSHRSNTLPSQDELHLHKSDLLQEIDSSFFAISDLTVMNLPASTHKDVTHIPKKNFVQSRVEKLSGFADNSREKYITTQMSSPPSTRPSISGHPEADYDVYPRKSVSRSASTNALTESPEMVNGDHVTLMSPRIAYPQSSAQLPLDRARSVQQASNSLQRFTQEPANSFFSAQESLPNDFMPQVESAPGQHMKTSSNPQQSLQYPPNDLMPVPELLKASQPAFQPHPRLPRTPEKPSIHLCHIPRVTYRSLSLSATSSDHIFSGSPPPQTHQSQKREAEDTDSRSLPFQFYKRDSSFLAPTTSKSAPLPYLPQKPLSRDETTTPNTRPVPLSEMDRGSEPSDARFILYKGPNLMSLVPKEALSPVLEQAHHAPLLTEANTAPENPEVVSSAKLKSNSQPESATTPLPRSPRSEVPIPPRDFDSDADNSEYIYTSKGWSHMADIPNIVTAMFCTGVEDDSARYVAQLYRPTQDGPYENIMHTFLRDSLPNNTTLPSLTNMDTAKMTQLFQRPLYSKLSTSKLSMNLDKSLRAHKSHFFDAIDQHGRVGHESPDLDSGVSLDSQNSRDSFRDVDLNGSDDLLVPGADYSSNCSNTLSSSMELGWDYLSCNESIKEMDKRRQL